MLLRCLMLAVAADPVCHVGPLHGAPAFFIDGRPSSGICYSSYDARDIEMGRRAAQFHDAGCRIFNFVVEVSGYGYSPPMWTGPEQWDFAELDRRAHTVLRNAPDAFLLPRIYLDAPAWWREQNPGEMMLLSTGSSRFDEKHFALQRVGDYPSLASEKWREAMDGALRTVLAHIAQSDYGERIVGYQLSGQKTEEWYHWSMNCPLLGDYSDHARAAFKQWLRRRYRDDVALRRAWHRPEVTLGTAEIPSQEARFGDAARTFRDPAAEQPVIDVDTFEGLEYPFVADLPQDVEKRVSAFVTIQ
ncbi:MAG: hypothetical protein HYU66_27880, partial [Armatimonadetes bacterium]|nr:hypothetical protein [Armatimonadota bacterium]